MTELKVDFGGGREVTEIVNFPSNSHKLRGVEKESLLPSPVEFKDNRKHYYVQLKCAVWPEIYGKQLPIHFPNLKAAWAFAEGNLSPIWPVARVYTPDNDLAWTFIYEEK